MKKKTLLRLSLVLAIISMLGIGGIAQAFGQLQTYLPIVVNNHAEAPTPTASPPGLPMPGVWSGTTNQDFPVNFTVASSSTYVSQFSIRYRLICTNGSVEAGSGTISGHFAITNSHFTVSFGEGEVYKGTFTSTTSAHGTWSRSYYDPFIGNCSGSGTWTAAR